MVMKTGKGYQVNNIMKHLDYENRFFIFFLLLIKQLGYITTCNKDIWIVKVKDKELLFHLEVDIGIGLDEQKMLMKDI